jgi:hypothetical protein
VLVAADRSPCGRRTERRFAVSWRLAEARGGLRAADLSAVKLAGTDPAAPADGPRRRAYPPSRMELLQPARCDDDQRGTAAYRRHALAVLARRALTWAWAT